MKLKAKPIKDLPEAIKASLAASKTIYDKAVEIDKDNAWPVVVALVRESLPPSEIVLNMLGVPFRMLVDSSVIPIETPLELPESADPNLVAVFLMELHRVLETDGESKFVAEGALAEDIKLNEFKSQAEYKKYLTDVFSEQFPTFVIDYLASLYR